MKRLLVLSLLLVGLVIFCVRCGSEASDLEEANYELHKVKTAIDACLSDAHKTQLDSAVMAWDGSSGKVTATSDYGSVYDAGYYIQGEVLRATYDVSQNGDITGAHNISWEGVEFDATYPQISHWVKAP
jgi:hypothetical protein